MYSRQTILTQLQPFQNKKHILVHDQSVGDIMKGILTTHIQYVNQYNKIAPFFMGATPEATAKNVWHFVKQNVRYKVEPEHEQLLKSPAAIIAPTVGGKINTSDCKNMSLFIGGVLDAAKRKGQHINWCYRFASYNLYDKVPQHVFIVLNPDTSSEIWVDAVLPSFNNRKQYYYKTDKKAQNMALVSLAGTKKKKKAAPATTKQEKKKKRQEFFKKLKEKTKKAGKLILKYNPATVVSRNAFLKLVQLNVRSLATNLQRIVNAGDTEAFKIWTKVGGNVDSLKKAIETGAKKKRLGAVPAKHIRRVVKTVQPTQARVTDTFNPMPVSPVYPSTALLPDSNMPEDESIFETEPAEEVEIEENIVGVVDPATGTAAAIAAAAPIVALILPLLKRNKNKLSSGTDAETLLQDVNADVAKESQDVADAIDKEAAGIETEKGNQIIKGGTTVPAGAGGKIPLLPIAAGAAVLFFLTKKK